MTRSLLAVAVLFGPLTSLPAARDKSDSPATGEEAPAVKLNSDEKALIDFVNKTRGQKKLSRLKPNALLCKAARQHNDNMAKQEKMEHVLDGKGPGQRVLAVGYDYRKVAENLAKAEGEPDDPAPAPADIHKHWMDSKGHRKNILEPKFTEVGVSMGRSKKGTIYYTMVFGVQRD
jgi:uncharacterized protein YkwD